MKRPRSNIRILIIVLGFLMGMPSTLFSKSQKDSLVLQRLFSYAGNDTVVGEGYRTHFYMKRHFSVERRNITLWAIPRMYALARGERQYETQSEGTITFQKRHQYDIDVEDRQSTVPYGEHPIPTDPFLTPNLYAPLIIDGEILSPFHKDNERYYRYQLLYIDASTAYLIFYPLKLRNTRFIRGCAWIDIPTGRIIKAELIGEFDSLSFKTKVLQQPDGILTSYSSTKAMFNFVGNKIAFDLETVLGTNDSIVVEKKEVVDTISTDSAKSTHRTVTPKWLADRLVSSIRGGNERISFRLSPILNPQYISYSRHKGLSYRIKGGLEINIGTGSRLTLNPWIGYNFKLSKIYFQIPLRFYYAPNLDGYADFVYGNGNRISNRSVLTELERQNIPSETLDGKQLDEFNDNHLRLSNHLRLTSWLEVEAGLVYHYRRAANAAAMRQLNMPVVYRSLAPMLLLKFRPWPENGPVFSMMYERGIKTDSLQVKYERWEADASMKFRISTLQQFILRIGGGFYTHRQKNYFLDFANFHENNLPVDYDDDWNGDFQLLSSRHYNDSRFYVRGNIGYESPILALAWIPYIGRFVERENIYLNTILLQDRKLYSELGYAFTTRYLSFGLFTSFWGTNIEEVGAKFTFQLFRRW